MGARKSVGAVQVKDVGAVQRAPEAGGGGATNWFELKPPGGTGSAGTIWSLKP